MNYLNNFNALNQAQQQKIIKHCLKEIEIAEDNFYNKEEERIYMYIDIDMFFAAVE